MLNIVSVHTQSRAAIRRYNAESQDLELVRQTLHPYSLFARMKLYEGLNGKVARERRTITIPDVNNPPSEVRLKLSSESIQSLVAAPIIFKNEYYGNLSLSHNIPNHFLDPDIELIDGLATQLAMTLYRLASVENATELERRAKEAEVMSSIGQSAGELAHRLGNDLGLIRSYVNNVQRILREYGVAHLTLDENLTKIVQDTRRALGLANNVRDQLQTLQNEGQQTKEWVDLPVSTLLEETARSHSQLSSNIEIRLEIHDDSQVRIVQRQVVAILRNLFFNAVQAMPEGGILTLRSRSEGRYVALQVDDTGIGIAPENLSKIFTLGFSTKKDNSGFGLWSARRYALLNQGDLSVISDLGQGTIFTLLLPKSEVRDYGTAI